MKKLLSVLLLALVALCAVPAAAQVSPPVCSGPPVASGSAGAKNSASPNVTWITSFYAWSAGEQYSLKVWRDDGTPRSYKLSFGAASDTKVLTGSSCIMSLFGGACSAFTGSRITKMGMVSTQTPGGMAITMVLANDVKVAEFYGISVFGAFNTNPQYWTDGLARITADTGSNSTFFFEGWHEADGVSSWKQVRAKFFAPGACGGI